MPAALEANLPVALTDVRRDDRAESDRRQKQCRNREDADEPRVEPWTRQRHVQKAIEGWDTHNDCENVFARQLCDDVQ